MHWRAAPHHIQATIDSPNQIHKSRHRRGARMDATVVERGQGGAVVAGLERGGETPPPPDPPTREAAAIRSARGRSRRRRIRCRNIATNPRRKPHTNRVRRGGEGRGGGRRGGGGGGRRLSSGNYRYRLI